MSVGSSSVLCWKALTGFCEASPIKLADPTRCSFSVVSLSADWDEMLSELSTTFRKELLTELPSIFRNGLLTGLLATAWNELVTGLAANSSNSPSSVSSAVNGSGASSVIEAGAACCFLNCNLLGIWSFSTAIEKRLIARAGFTMGEPASSVPTAESSSSSVYMTSISPPWHGKLGGEVQRRLSLPQEGLPTDKYEEPEGEAKGGSSLVQEGLPMDKCEDAEGDVKGLSLICEGLPMDMCGEDGGEGLSPVRGGMLIGKCGEDGVEGLSLIREGPLTGKCGGDEGEAKGAPSLM